MSNQKLPEPQAGGRYVREANGSLTQLHKTEPALPRSQRADAPADGAPGADAPDTADNNAEE